MRRYFAPGQSRFSPRQSTAIANARIALHFLRAACRSALQLFARAQQSLSASHLCRHVWRLGPAAPPSADLASAFAYPAKTLQHRWLHDSSCWLAHVPWHRKPCRWSGRCQPMQVRNPRPSDLRRDRWRRTGRPLRCRCSKQRSSKPRERVVSCSSDPPWS